MSLIEYVRGSPLLRTIYVHRMKRPLAVACNAGHIDNAIAWCREKTGRAPDFFYLGGKATDRNDVPLITAAELLADPSIAVIVFGNTPRRMAIKLAQDGISQVYFHKDPGFKNFKGDAEFLKKHREKLEAAFSLLEDEESRLTFASVIKQRLTADHGYLRVAKYPEYSHPLVKAMPGDWAIDGGAFDGATSVEFARQAGANGSVHAVEPDPANVEKIKERLMLATSPHAPIAIHAVALSDQEGETRFSCGQGGSSRPGDEGSSLPASRSHR